MDGLRDGLNRLWRDGVTILPRPAKKIATAKNNRPVPALEKTKKNTAPSRPVEKKKKATPSRLGKKQQPPRPASKKKQPPRPASEKKTPPHPASKKIKTAPSRHEQQNTPPRGWKLETNTTACLFFSLSCCTFISYCSLVRSIFLFFFSVGGASPTSTLPAARPKGTSPLSLLSSATYKVTRDGARLRW